jgi:hypothetical protein
MEFGESRSMQTADGTTVIFSEPTSELPSEKSTKATSEASSGRRLQRTVTQSTAAPSLDDIPLEELVADWEFASASEQRESATVALSKKIWDLKESADGQASIVENCRGAVRVLVDAIDAGSERAQVYASQALTDLILLEGPNLVVVSTCGALRGLVTLLGSGSPHAQEYASVSILNAFFDERTATSVFQTPGLLEALAVALRLDSSIAQTNAALVLASICEDTDGAAAAVNTPGLMEALVFLLGSGEPHTTDVAFDALLNITCVEELIPELTNTPGMMKALCAEFLSERSEAQRMAAELLDRMTFGDVSASAIAVLNTPGALAALELQ